LTWNRRIAKLPCMVKKPVIAIWVMLLAAIAVPAIAAAPDTVSFAGQGLALTGLDGKRIPLDTLLTKGPVVLNFWATWCGPCRVEMPQLQKVYLEMEGKRVSFAAVSLDRGMKREVLENFLKGRGIVVPVYRDESGNLAKTFGVAAIPATFVLGPGGEVIYRTKGYHPGDEILLRKKVEEAMASAEKATDKKAKE
jgi:cytochrome c biogenesis protein CcmG/thiol:disulfide interchange protein DsbE